MYIVYLVYHMHQIDSVRRSFFKQLKGAGQRVYGIFKFNGFGASFTEKNVKISTKKGQRALPPGALNSPL